MMKISKIIIDEFIEYLSGWHDINEETVKKIREFYLAAYYEAITDYGIWKNGVQKIGCMETPIKEIYERKAKEVL